MPNRLKHLLANSLCHKKLLCMFLQRVIFELSYFMNLILPISYSYDILILELAFLTVKIPLNKECQLHIKTSSIHKSILLK